MAKTSRKSDAKRAKYGVWRWYKPAQLRTDNDELLPDSSLSNILALTNFPDLKSLMAEINKHQAFEIPEPLQKRLRRLFDLGVFPEALNRKISVEVDDETFEMPYPFKADRKKAKAKMIIAALDIEKNKQAAAVSFYARIYIGSDLGDALAKNGRRR